MSREIQSARDALLYRNTTPSVFKDRLVKLIPSEIIAAYVTISGLVQGYAKNNPGAHKATLLYAVIGILLLLTPFYLKKIADVTKTGQLVFSSIAFVVWAFATNSPYTENVLGFSFELIISLILILYTLLIPVFYKG